MPGDDKNYVANHSQYSPNYCQNFVTTGPANYGQLKTADFVEFPLPF